MDVDRYLNRINYTGSKVVSVENLRALCRCNATSVPEDTLDLFGGPGKVPTLEAIYKNVVESRRGGLCYEQNGIFDWLLDQLGYNVVMIEGSYHITEEDEFSYPFNHMLLKVTIENQEWIIDVGFGSPSFYEPLKFVNGIEQTQSTGMYRIRQAKDDAIGFLIEKHIKEVHDMKSAKIKSKRPKTKSKYEVDNDWNIMLRFSTSPQKWENFMVGWSLHVDDEKSWIRTNSFLQIFTQDGSIFLWGTKLIEKTHCSPLVEKSRHTEMMPGIDKEKELAAINRLMKEKFGVVLDFEPEFASIDYGTTVG